MVRWVAVTEGDEAALLRDHPEARPRLLVQPVELSEDDVLGPLVDLQCAVAPLPAPHVDRAFHDPGLCREQLALGSDHPAAGLAPIEFQDARRADRATLDGCV